MTPSRDHCPDCGHKLHPQELERLFRGKKLDCWHCDAPLKARAKGHLSVIAQIVAGTLPLFDTAIAGNPNPWSGYALAALVVFAIHILPPGLIHGAPWVRIVGKKDSVAPGET